VHHKGFSKADSSIVLAYPDVYDVGMSYYGFQILYHILNRKESIIADRVYAPWTDYEKQLRVRSLPLCSLESRIPVRQFDLLGFTLPYELTSTNILNMLDLSQIPIYSENRTDRDPIVIAGGSNSYNPEPLSPFIEIFVIGDSEAIIVPLVEFIAERKRNGIPRRELLRDVVRSFQGVYVPLFYDCEPNNEGFMVAYPSEPGIPDKIRSLRVPELQPDYFPEKPVLPLIEIAQDRLVAEIMRGCTQGCRFCQAGMIYRPVRERYPADIQRQIENSLSATGYENVSLLSLSSSDYNGMSELVNGISGLMDCQRIGLSLPSMRLDSFSPEIAYIAHKTRKSGLTFAPEAGSQRLRNVINKKISEEDLLRSVDIALQYGWRTIKLYFMLGLPTETDEDIEAIIRLAELLLQRGHKQLNLNITLSTFIPKPFTPFQWEPQDDPVAVQRKLDMLKPRLRSLKHVKVMARDPFYSQLEGVLSRGDRRVAGGIYDAWKAGAKFDSWRENFVPTFWSEAFLKNEIDPGKYMGKKKTNNSLPWDHIDSLVSQTFLLKERELAHKGIISQDCRDGCIGCGVCDPGSLEMKLVAKKEPPENINEEVNPIEPEQNPIRYRLRYQKKGLVRFISHLDILRVFQQAIRRAGLEPVFSQGYNRRPKISSGYPLPLGYSSDEEYIEVILKKEARDIVNRLNRQLPEGLEIEAMSVIPLKAASIFSEVAGFDYEIDVLGELPEGIAEKISAFLEMEEVLIERERKHRKKTINLRKFVATINLMQHKLLLKTRVVTGQTARVAEILDYLGIDKNILVCRKKTYFKTN
jgi:radical SAM family uncharacterized protein/radical SAM-linked protein